MNLGELSDITEQIGELDAQISKLNDIRADLRTSLLDTLKELDLASFESNHFRASRSVRVQVKGTDIAAIAKDFDLSDCYELSLSKIKEREDIDIKKYSQTSEVQTLRISVLK